MLLSGARVVTPSGVIEHGWVQISNGRIALVGEDRPSPPEPGESFVVLEGRTVLPGCIDLHVHGGSGGSFRAGASEECRRVVEFHRSFGTTRSLASLAAAPVDELCAALGALADLTADGVIFGAHLEGPFLSALRCGAQDPRHLLDPQPALVDQLLESARGCVRMMTLAPELPGAVALVKQLVDRGVIAAIGHSDATYEQASRAIDAGASVATHLGNAMRPIHQREPGIAVAALDRSEVTCELIADGQHLHPAMLRLAFATAKGRVALVTDAMSATGLPDGHYQFGSLDVEVAEGRSRINGTSTLAGSTITMSNAVRYATAVVELPLEEVASAAASTPARLLGLEGEVGSIVAGGRADLVVVDTDLRVEKVMIDGSWLSPNGGE